MMAKDRKIRRPKHTPAQITITFDLLGNADKRRAQYMWLKMLERTTLSAVMEALFECETIGHESHIVELSNGMLHTDDMDWSH